MGGQPGRGYQGCTRAWATQTKGVSQQRVRLVRRRRRHEPPHSVRPTARPAAWLALPAQWRPPDLCALGTAPALATPRSASTQSAVKRWHRAAERREDDWPIEVQQDWHVDKGNQPFLLLTSAATGGLIGIHMDMCTPMQSGKATQPTAAHHGCHPASLRLHLGLAL